MTLDDMLSDPSQITVEVTNPEGPFGGVLVQQAAERPLLVEINTGSPVNSVFGRVGAVVAQCSDYSGCYLQKQSPLPATPTTLNQVIALLQSYGMSLLLMLAFVFSVDGAQFGDIPANLTMPASQAVRRNAGDTAFEAFTPAGGGGTVTSFSAGNLGPLFNTTVTNPTTTPSLSFTQIAVLPQSVYGNPSGIGTFPVFTSSPAFAAISNLTGNGFVKTSGGTGTLSIDTNTYLTANQPITLTGPITGGPSVTTIPTSIGSQVVTYGNIQSETSSTLLGRGSTTSGSPQEITLGPGLGMSGSTLSATGGASGANPTALVGLSAVNGTSINFIRSDGAPAIDQSITPTWSGIHTWKVSDAATTTITYPISIGHNSSGTPATGFGTGVTLNAKDSTTNDQELGEIDAFWTSATHGNLYSDVIIKTVQGGAPNQRVRVSGGLSVGVTANDVATGTISADNGYQINAGAAPVGNFLQGNGTYYAASAFTFPTTAGTKGTNLRWDGTNVVSITVPYGVVTTTVDQTATAEQAHVVYTVPLNSAAAGSTYKLTAWGDMDNGTTAITYTPRLRWGGTGGTLLLTGPAVVGTTTAQTNKNWKIVANLTVRTIGAPGTGFSEMAVSNHTASSTGAYAADENNSGGTAVNITTSSNSDLDLTWTLSATTGTPHVRTYGGYVEIIN